MLHVRMRYGFLLLCFSMVIIACNEPAATDQSSPEAAVKGLFEALKAGDFETAKLYGTTSTQESLLDFKTNLNMISDDEKKEVLAPYNMEISKVTCAEEQGQTNCELCCSDAGEVRVEVVQQEQKWFVQMEFAY